MSLINLLRTKLWPTKKTGNRQIYKLDNSPATTIHDLPPEMLFAIFDNLRLKDQAACSLVSKHWNSVYSNCLKVHRLVSFKSFEFSISKWSHSKQRIEEDELFKTQNFSELKNKEILANLKQLAICYNCFDLNILNNFCQLVHLEIFLENSKEGSVWKLKLPKLKILVLHPVHRFASVRRSLLLQLPFGRSRARR